MGGNSAELGYGRRHALNRAHLAGPTTLILFGLWFSLPASGAFSVERATLHQYEDGPELAAAHVFLPGEPIYFACRLAGYQPATDPKDESRSVRMSWKFAVVDPNGIAVVPASAGVIAEPLSRQDKDWRPKFLQNFTVPPFAPPGKYHIKVEASDEVAKATVSSQVEFEVRGHTVEPSAELATRNLHFLRSEQDGPPLDPVAYHPGETLWARFDITGFGYEQKAEKSRFSVEYGLAVLKESGAQVFAQPGAAADAGESFYAQRYVPGALSLTLDPKVPLGSYILLITVEDKISGQKTETRGAFQIQ